MQRGDAVKLGGCRHRIRPEGVDATPNLNHMRNALLDELQRR
jgi:hypothetical protein